MATNKIGTKAKLFTNYVIIALLPVIVCSVLLLCQISANGTLSINTNLMSGLEQYSARTDLLWQQMEDTAEILTRNYDTFGENNEGNSDMIASVLANYTFSQYSAEGSSNQIIFMLHGSNQVITPDGTLPYFSFSQQFGTVSLDLSSFYSISNRAKISTTFPLRLNSTEKQYSGVVAHMVPITDRTNSVIGTVAFLIDNSILNDICSSIFGDTDGLYYILTPYMQTVFCSDISQFESSISQRLIAAKGAGPISIDLDGKDCILLKQVSKETGFTYIAALPRSSVYAELNNTIRTYAVICAILLTAVLASAIAWASVSYRPIRDLASKIAPAAKDNNVFDSIETEYQRINDINTELLRDTEHLQKLIRGPILLDLLMNEHKNSSTMTDILLSAGITFPYKHFFVMIIRNRDGKLQQERISAAIEDNTFSNAVLYTIPVTDGEEYAIIANVDIPSSSETDPTREAVATDILDTISIPGSSVTIGVGLCFDSLAYLGSSLLEAEASLYDESTVSPVRLYTDRLEYASFSGIMPSSERARFIECAVRGSINEAVLLFDTMCSDIRKYEYNRSLVLAWRMYMNNMVSEMFQRLNCTDPVLDSIHTFFTCTLEEYQSLLREKILYVLTQYSHPVEKQSTRSEQLVSYIQKHYTDIDLSLDALASEFDISVKTVCDLLKKSISCSFLQYVTSLRIEHAKSLLINTDLLIKDIAEQTGYADAASFSRRFKAVENMTPQRYRDLYKIV